MWNEDGFERYINGFIILKLYFGAYIFLMSILI